MIFPFPSSPFLLFVIFGIIFAFAAGSLFFDAPAADPSAELEADMALAALTSNDFAYPPNLTPDEHFRACCDSIDLGVPPACQYPPGPLTPFQQVKVALKFRQYIGCYAGHKNNRQCCIASGVTPDYCPDLCDGANPPAAALKYRNCDSQKGKIAECNKLAWGPNMMQGPNQLMDAGALGGGLNLYQLLTLDILLKNHRSLEELKKMVAAQQKPQTATLLALPAF